ncbi:hypothetical protein TrLO_g14477 [Triparma laevis f. longispina]|uniref:Mitochondrial carrier n=1 Tax=Triparma laevis f. longispina TaxID=1714387 RepID=A0A9W7A4I1_9STRA|nr:hypothetical protein TrLO_g14477 [Triparma laevis f. longispina]
MSSPPPPPLLRRHTTRIDNTQTIYALKASILAGYAAGCCGLIIGHPLDTMKVHLQTNSRTPLILRNVYNGIIPPLLTIGFVQSINFAIYDNCRRYFFNNYPREPIGRDFEALPLNYLTDDTILSISLSSLIAGSLVSTVTSPMMKIKTLQQIHSQSLIEAIKTASKRGGVRTFYNGFGVHVLCEGPGRAVYMGGYEFLKREVTGRRNVSSLEATTVERMGCAGVAGIGCWTVIYPFDVVRSRIYGRVERVKVGGVVREIYREGGIRGFTRGILPTVARAGPVAATVLPIYDGVLQYLIEEEI